ncbi:hypothetical protein GNX18_16760 [Microbulbifer sp. SH-1]|uniref:hypothetical protein n=1 Tax=Microbulbifer sp. SH-1 TaxID=2681547 RepID=UPI00140DD1EC|nr:hypothetical protein [Microbulbifer sp. SH-1]QIL91249.1 hypothetical protein GNX18_16760 [Microbulbifer sp. SH-1]
MKLLYRGDKFNDESLPDYIFRLAYWNGFDSGSRLIDLLRIHYKELAKHYFCDERLHVAKKLSVWYECKVALEFILNKSFHESELNLEIGLLIKKKYHTHWICSECWKEYAYVRFYWHSCDYRNCHVHDKRLLQVEFIPYEPSLNPERIAMSPQRDWPFPDCEVTPIFLKKRIGNSCNYSDIENEKSISIDEEMFWWNVIVFLRDRFKIDFKVDSVYELIPIDELVGAPVTQRLQKVKDSLIREKEVFATLISVSIVAKIIQKRMFGFEDYGYLLGSRELKNWLLSEAYSVSRNFYTYLVGVGDHIFFGSENLVDRRVPPIDLRKVSDKGLCQFILESSILTPQEIRDITSEWECTSNSAIKIEGYVGRRHYYYNKYIQAADLNVFDMEPEPR